MWRLLLLAGFAFGATVCWLLLSDAAHAAPPPPVTVRVDITVRLPEDVGLAIDLVSTSGEVACAFDGLDEEIRPGARRLRGAVGDGSGHLSGRTVSGSLAVLVRQSA